MCIALIVAFSCSKKQEEPVVDNGFTLRAGLDEVSTRTVIGEKNGMGKYPIYWVDGDVISVNGVISDPLSGQSGESSSANFRFAGILAPASIYNVLCPGTTYSDKVTFDGISVPLYGNSTDLSAGVSMRTPATVVRFEYKGTATLTDIVVTSMQGEKISGPFTMSKDGSGALTGVLAPDAGATGTITISYDGGLELTPGGKTIYFVIPPGTYPKCLRAVVNDNTGSRMTLRFFKSGAVLTAGRACSFPEITYVAGSDVVMTGGEGFEPIDIDLQEGAGTGDMDASTGEIKVSLKAGTFNIWAPSARKSVMDADPEVSEQRSWANSYESVADMINWLDCDVMGLQEITAMAYETTYTKKKDYDGGEHYLNDILTNYGWVIYNAANTSYDSWFPGNTTGNGLGSTDAIIYKKSVLTLVSHGRYWLSGSRKIAPQDAGGVDYGTNRPCTWAKFTHKASGKSFYFVTTHLDLPNAGGPDDDNEYAQRRNASELIDWFMPEVATEDIPSIICGDMNCTTPTASYDILCSGKWTDVYDVMKADGTLDYTERCYPGTMNLDKKESGLSSWRPDHMFTYGCTVSYYKTAREKFATKDSSMHWPSDHFPIKIIVNF